MHVIHENNNQNSAQETRIAPEVAAPVRPQIAPPGEPLSFEEALAQTMKQYDNALRELAK